MPHFLRGLAIGTAITGSLIATTVGLGAAGRTAPTGPTTLAVFGDLPYGDTPDDGNQFRHLPEFIASVNNDPSVSTAVFGGDLHSGKQYCTKALNDAEFAIFGTLRMPFVYVPGDNEWTDCTKAKQLSGKVADFYSGAKSSFHNGNPVENLELIRATFFPVPGWTLGVKGMRVLSQATVSKWGRKEYRTGSNPRTKDHIPSSIKVMMKSPTDKQFVENVMWENAKTLFVAVNIPGGSNNDLDPWYGDATCGAGSKTSITDQQVTEMSDRSDATVHWISAAFAKARRDGMASVAIITQADMWDLDGCPAAANHLSGYDRFVNVIADQTAAFRRPVLFLNGDSHIAKVDNPLDANDPLNSLHPGHDVKNFRRVVWNGSTTIRNSMEWIKLTVTPGTSNPAGPNAFGPFTWSTTSVKW
jgi:hypothetical protein